jgi:hypothetical protein
VEGDDARKEFRGQLMRYLRDRWRSTDARGVVVRRHEVAEVAGRVGVHEKEAWRLFEQSRGLLW